ncbi:oxidoreductase, NAD-binding Rossmann fold family protein [Bacteroides fragilis str. S36L5]|nr:oxidoreductase, NAD-binding Rossmann fold family protein [Bacteroides fragilis str. DS-208]EXZ81955.1 oxidoreductase, NAD-binding Rossmann fold family protein [Bacteroides fragilis str. B1 (UDC16-1)]EYA03347.1 oxidoreductase, NAD-binding Rossmann fold family protein [Bacteroides fragilis str. S6L3]EYA08112.1 oxidoreductase, NAD-binding Rossmann fold family protein [Bacteroides fragilis str. S6R6]EYA89364.1 oxidoreductase, NAD-binding Rossmann fold family protein [Bacteroides fragilis str. S3
MAGAGRATELHINALKRFTGIPLRFKMIVARRKEQLEVAKAIYGFEETSYDFEDLLTDPDIDVIDICTPPYVHEEMIERAMLAGKHVICEKPLTGYFGMSGDEYPIGINVSKKVMYLQLLESIRRLRQIIRKSGKKFMYAENFVYAPAVLKAAEIITAKKSRILYAKGEESLKGSSSPVAGEWDKTGGGTFIRTGSHPLSAILWLKQQEAKAHGIDIKVKSVIADMGRITPNLSDYEHRHIAANPVDVEDCGTVILNFTDDSRAVIIATDTLLGGSKNYVELYCNDAAINCTLTMSDLMSTYFLDEDNLDNVYISEMLPSKIGWNKPFLEDEIIRGYTDEMRDFMEAIFYDRDPKAGFDLAYDTIRIIYAAYMSAEMGCKVELDTI